MIDATSVLHAVIKQCQQTLRAVSSDLAVLSAVVTILEEERYHVTPVPTYNLTAARGRLQTLRSVSWRLRFCRSAAERTARHAISGRSVADEDVRAFNDYLALALEDLAGAEPLTG